MTETSLPGDQRRHLFLIAGARENGNTESLARRAAAALPASVEQRWLRLADLPLPAFEDVRHDGTGVYPPPEGAAKLLLEETLAATDIVFVAPLYWYTLPTNAKLYLDHWSGWMRVEGVNFKARMASKTAWAITVYSDVDETMAEPLFAALRLSATYLGMRWGGSLLGEGNRPGDVMSDGRALAAAETFFIKPVARAA